MHVRDGVQDTTGAHADAEGVVSLESEDAVALVGALRRHWRRIVLVSVTGALLVFAATFLAPQTYRARVSVVPAAVLTGQSQSALAGALVGAAAQLGLAAGDGGTGASGLLAPILRSRRLGERLLMREFSDRRGSRVKLIDLLAGANPDSARRLDEALRELNRHVLKVRLDVSSGVTTVSAELPDPQVAAAVANVSAEELDTVNREARSAQAKAWVVFTAQRVAEASAVLGREEKALADFRDANRSTAGSPRLQMEEARLVREVEFARAAFIAAREQNELARAEEVKNVPVITVLDRAVPPVKPYRPRRVFMALSAFVLLLVAATAREIAAAYLDIWRSGNGASMSR